MNEPYSIDSQKGFDWADNFHSIYYRTLSYIKRYWWIVLITTFIGGTYKAYEEMEKPPVYESVAKLRLIGGGVINPEGDKIQENNRNLFGDVITEIRSPQIIEQAHEIVEQRYPGLDPVPVNLIPSHIRGTSYFLLRARGGGRAYVKAYLEAHIEVYLNERKKQRSNTAQTGMAAIMNEIQGLELEMQQLEDQKVEFQRNNNIAYIQEHGASSGNFLSELKQKLAALKLKQRVINNITLDQQLTGTIDLLNTNEHLTRSNDFRSQYFLTKEELNQLIVQRDEYSLDLKPKHPMMIGLNRSIRQLQDKLSILEQHGQKQLVQDRAQIDHQINSLLLAISDAEQETLMNSRLLAEYERMESRLSRKEQRADKLTEFINNIDMEINMESQRIELSEKPNTASEYPKNVSSSAVKGGIMGMLAGCMIVFLLGGLDKRVVSTEDLKQVFPEPVLGIIPKEKTYEASTMGFLQDKGKRHMFTEAFRTLRSSLLFLEASRESEGGQHRNTFIVTSAVPEEGKSTIASNLAISLAYATSRTLLVDADLRRGHLNRLFKRPNRGGLIEVLQGRATLDECIQPTEVEHLDFIPRGESTSNTAELLISREMEDCIQWMSENYDYVIFDAAPVLATDDTTSFASKVDSILYVVRSNMIRVRQVRVALDNLKMRGANILGFVMNFADTRGMDYYYYNKYQYYYRDTSTEADKELTGS